VVRAEGPQRTPRRHALRMVDAFEQEIDRLRPDLFYARQVQDEPWPGRTAHELLDVAKKALCEA